VVLGAQPPAQVVIAVTMILFFLWRGFATGEYNVVAVTVHQYAGHRRVSRTVPVYEGGIRLAMNLAGALIVLVVVFGASWLVRHRVYAEGKIDSVSKIVPKGVASDHRVG